MLDDKNNYSVYIHKNIINGKVYIGLTKQMPENRWRNGAGYYGNKEFYADIQQYGWNTGFEHTIIKNNLTESEASDLERELINQYNSIEMGYHKNSGGTVGCKITPETRNKIRNAMLGKTHSNETKDKIRKSVAHLKRPVICMETGKEYDGIIDAEKDTGIDSSSIVKVCKGETSTAGNYHWSYKENVDNFKPKQNEGMHPVICITINLEYPSVQVTSNDTKIDASNIIKACNGKYLTAGGLEWRFNGEAKKPKRKSKREKEVICITTGKIYSSASEAAKDTGCDRNSIGKVCRGINQSAKGLKWKFYEKKGESEEDED